MASKVTQKIYADGKVESGEWKMSLEEMQKFVGGYIEMVRSVVPHRTLVVNEEGVYENLPINFAATALVTPGTSMVGGIRGDVLLVKQ